MKHFNRFFAAFLVTLLLVSLSACASKMDVPALAPTPEVSVEVTATLTATLTATPVPTETPVPTLSPEEEKEILNQQFQDFLNKKGEFTEEKMDYMPIYVDGRGYKDGSDLGILRIFTEDEMVMTYGYLFDIVKDESGNIGLIMGFDGCDGNRFITVLTICNDAYDYNYKSISDSEKYRMFFVFSIEKGPHLDDNSVVQLEAINSNEIYNYLISLKNKRLAVDIPARKVHSNDLKGGVKEFWDEANERLPYTYNLIYKSATNGVDISMIRSSGNGVQLISSFDELGTIDYKSVPIIIGVRYK